MYTKVTYQLSIYKQNKLVHGTPVVWIVVIDTLASGNTMRPTFTTFKATHDVNNNSKPDLQYFNT